MSSYFKLLLFSSILFSSCSTMQEVDLLIYNAKVYTVDSSFSTTSAIAIKDGKILETGTSETLTAKYDAKENIDAKGKFIYPGFIDAHAHFYNYSLELQRVNVFGSKSWQEVVDKTKAFASEHPTGWIIGRGWDQNLWENKVFPNKEQLDSLFPSRPVLLRRVDGHAAIANQAALDLAGIKPGMSLIGGTVETKDGKLTGLLIDNAIDYVSEKIPEPTAEDITTALKEAQENCFAVGLTTVDDCGLKYHEVLTMDSLQKKDILKMRVYAMLSDLPENYEWLFANGKMKTGKMHVRSFKIYADGALGSRGANLLKPYHDQPGWHGFLLNTKEHFDSVANILYQKDFQMCTHAIGDSGNRTVLNIYANYLKGPNDRRWRIEHAQVVNSNDYVLFQKYNVVPSVQPTHATSDMYWAGRRLGGEREKEAYAYRQLMEQNGWLPLGTDFPVEDISPFKTFYAAVFRMDGNFYPEGGYQPENALTREQALRGMTIWAARSNFEENEKGSLEKGKLADFIILDKDIMQAEAKDVLGTKVLGTYVGGVKVFGE